MEMFGSNGTWQKCRSVEISTELRIGQQQRRAHASSRGKAGAYGRASDLAIRRAERSDRNARTKMRRLERELGLLDDHRIWGKPLNIRLPRRVSRAFSKAARVAAGKLRALPAYRKALRDNRGRVAVYMRVRYLGFKSPRWKDGCAAEHVSYTLRPEALHRDEKHFGWLSNMGQSEAEVADAWKVIEEVEKGYRSNAIVQYRIVVGLSHELSAPEQEKLIGTFCERTFGRLGLPYVAAIHKPDTGGDQRNYHAHICFSMRPVERVAPFEWSIAPEKVNQLTDPEGLKLMRAQFAAVLNRACRKAGLEDRYTHRTYQKRGIDAHRTDHCGPERTAAHQRGEHVDTVEKNARLIDRNQAVEDVRISRVRCNLAERRDHHTKRIGQLASLRDRISGLARAAWSIGVASKKAQAILTSGSARASRATLDQEAIAAAVSDRRLGVASAALEPPAQRHNNRQLLEKKREEAAKLEAASAAAGAAQAQAMRSAESARHLLELERWARETAALARGKLKAAKAGYAEAKDRLNADLDLQRNKATLNRAGKPNPPDPTGSEDQRRRAPSERTSASGNGQDAEVLRRNPGPAVRTPLAEQGGYERN